MSGIETKNKIKFTVLGEAVAQERARATTHRGRIRMYDPQNSRDFKQYVGLVASQHAPRKPLEGPLKVRLAIYRPMLKSFSRRRMGLAEHGLYRPTTKPDLDNYVKSISDALNKIIWKDDSQVVDLRVSKFYSEQPRIEIEVELLEIN
ncbi:RusA family crossover junction endodeoxyribonuclease [Ammoniphilus oxalaticus]|uniref:RusA family crossover junction endodeoxyribonuclease n=1 Tax=Ammoniphilus oxalaticus TaxID=66863 RepID=UPI003CCC4965